MQDVQSLLDSMLVPSGENLECIMANGQLSKAEKDLLRGIVKEFKEQGKKYPYEKALDDIANIMQRFKNVAKKVKGKNGICKICPLPNTAPFLLKQVLFYMVAACIANRLCTGKGVLDYLRGKGISVSHNYNSRMSTTPSSYIHMMSDAIPEMPMGYMGQKRDELGVAIKHLVYQAGKYRTFVDVFGGSGAASVSVTRDKVKERKKYVYNELNWAVYNLFEVIADPELHKLLISELGLLQKALNGDKSWIPEEELEGAAQKCSEKHPSAINVDKIMLDDQQDMVLGLGEVATWMQVVRQDILKHGEDEIFSLGGGKYLRDDLLKAIFSMRWSKEERGFVLNYQLIKEYIDKHMSRVELMFLFGDTYSATRGREERVSLMDKENLFMRRRFFQYYAYFEGLLDSGTGIGNDGKVRRALAELYYQTFRTAGRADVSSILRMFEWWNATGSNDFSKILDQNLAGRIKGMHGRVAGTVCENVDCNEVISKYGGTGGKTLFYCDSPYIATADYKDEAKGVGEFGAAKMEELIKALAGSGDKFIFSCRAVKNSQRRGKTTEKIKKANRRIMDEVHRKFLGYFPPGGEKLYVLAVEKSNQDLAALIRGNGVAEIMITNYRICDFEDKKGGDDTRFKVYTFEEFMEIMEKNAHLPGKKDA